MPEVMMMNASGNSKHKGTAARRKQAIQNVINRYNPDLVLFQEFEWQGIHGNKWLADPVPIHYRLVGNNDASILYNINELIVEERPAGELQRILEELQRPTSKHPTPIPQDFNPIPRMCLRVVKTKGVPVMEFICISWHGEHNRMSKKKKKTHFMYLMSFLNEIHEKYHLPILIAGDFNVDMKLIQNEVNDPFELYEYEALERRKKKGVIDYLIATRELYIYQIEPVDLTKDSTADKPEEVLDHDPVTAILDPADLSDSSSSTDSSSSE